MLFEKHCVMAGVHGASRVHSPIVLDRVRTTLHIATGNEGIHSALLPSGTSLDPAANAAGSGKHVPFCSAGAKSAGQMVALSVTMSRNGVKKTFE